MATQPLPDEEQGIPDEVEEAPTEPAYDDLLCIGGVLDGKIVRLPKTEDWLSVSHPELTLVDEDNYAGPVTVETKHVSYQRRSLGPSWEHEPTVVLVHSDMPFTDSAVIKHLVENYCGEV